MRSSLRHYAIAALVSLLVCLIAPASRAQSITLSPAVVPLKGLFGQSATQTLTLHNHSDLPLDFVMEAQDVIVQDGNRVFVRAGDLPDSIAMSAVFTPKEVSIGPRSKASVTVTLTLPPIARHRAVVAFFRGSNLVPAGHRQARLSVGTLFTFTVSDHISLAAGALEADPPSSNANARFRSMLVNDGEEPVEPTGMSVILDASGRLVGKAPFPRRRLLPGERTELVADYPGELGPGSYSVIATLDVAGRPLTLEHRFEIQ